MQPVTIRVGAVGTSNCAADAGDWLRLVYGYSSFGRNNGNMFGQNIIRTQPGQSNFNVLQNYTYDGSADVSGAVNGFNRLTEVKENTVSLEAYQFDNVGNMWPLSRNASLPGAGLPERLQPGANPFNAANRVTGWDNAGGYDAAGNLLSITGAGRMFTYDAENRQISATITASGGATTYFYDGDGRRVKKSLPSGAVTIFVYDAAGQLAHERGASMDTGLKFVAVDHLGSTRLEMDSQLRLPILILPREIRIVILPRRARPITRHRAIQRQHLAERQVVVGFLQCAVFEYGAGAVY